MTASASAQHRFLVKEVDHFAGFAHAINTYLSGVALADRHGYRLIHMPFRAAHGLGFAFDDFLSLDPRGLVHPLTAPVLTLQPGAALIDGRALRRYIFLDTRSSAQKIRSDLSSGGNGTLVWLRKGRFALFDEADCNCTRPHLHN